MAWLSIVSGLVKLLGTLAQWLREAGLIAAGRAEASAEADEARRTAAAEARRVLDATRRAAGMAKGEPGASDDYRD